MISVEHCFFFFFFKSPISLILVIVSNMNLAVELTLWGTYGENIWRFKCMKNLVQAKKLTQQLSKRSSDYLQIRSDQSLSRVRLFATP